MTRSTWLVLLFALVNAIGCVDKVNQAPETNVKTVEPSRSELSMDRNRSQPEQTSVAEPEEGLATWYGQGDHYDGKLTASGERFDKNKPTAAHCDLPFGTVVRIKNLRNNKELEVRVNDRLPAETRRKGYIIDVSYGASRKLEMDQDVVPVLVDIVSLPKQEPPGKPQSRTDQLPRKAK